MATFPLQGQGEGLDLTGLHFFVSEKYFNFMLKLLFGYESHLILHIICNKPLNMQRGTTAAQLPWKVSAVPKSSFISLKRALLYTIDL